MDAARHGGAPRCVGDVDWAPEQADYGPAVQARVLMERERENDLAVGLIGKRAW